MQARKVLPRSPDDGQRLQIVRETLPVFKRKADDLLVDRDRLGRDQVAKRRGAADGVPCLPYRLTGGRDVLQRRVIDIGQPVERLGRLAQQALGIDGEQRTGRTSICPISGCSTPPRPWRRAAA